MAEEILLTQEGYDKIVAEHEELVSVRRKEVSERLKEAISYGDLSENSEYDSAKNEQAELEVIADNKNAIALYEALGFVKYGQFPNNMKYADGTYADAIWMMKKL